MQAFRTSAETAAEASPGVATNSNRNSATTSIVQAIATSNSSNVSTAAASLISYQWVGSGRKIGSESRKDNEIMLKQNTKYDFRVENVSGGNNVVAFLLEWYEHTDKR